jgi:hypothetical protein
VRHEAGDQALDEDELLVGDKMRDSLICPIFPLLCKMRRCRNERIVFLLSRYSARSQRLDAEQ